MSERRFAFTINHEDLKTTKLTKKKTRDIWFWFCFFVILAIFYSFVMKS